MPIGGLLRFIAHQVLLKEVILVDRYAKHNQMDQAGERKRTDNWR